MLYSFQEYFRRKYDVLKPEKYYEKDNFQRDNEQIEQCNQDLNSAKEELIEFNKNIVTKDDQLNQLKNELEELKNIHNNFENINSEIKSDLRQKNENIKLLEKKTIELRNSNKEMESKFSIEKEELIKYYKNIIKEASNKEKKLIKTNEEICNEKIFKLQQKIDKLHNLNKKPPFSENQMIKIYQTTEDKLDEPIDKKRKRSK